MRFLLLQEGNKSNVLLSENAVELLDIKKRHIVKITANEKYIITKCGSVKWLCKEINSSYGKYNRGGILESNFFYKFIKYCYQNSIKKAVIEPLYSSGNGYNVLKTELEYLTEHFGNSSCLNTNNIPYIPKTIHAKRGSNWLTQNEYLNFMKLLKKYDY